MARRLVLSLLTLLPAVLCYKGATSLLQEGHAPQVAPSCPESLNVLVVTRTTLVPDVSTVTLITLGYNYYHEVPVTSLVFSTTATYLTELVTEVPEPVVHTEATLVESTVYEGREQVFTATSVKTETCVVHATEIEVEQNLKTLKDLKTVTLTETTTDYELKTLLRTHFRTSTEVQYVTETETEARRVTGTEYVTVTHWETQEFTHHLTKDVVITATVEKYEDCLTKVVVEGDHKVVVPDKFEEFKSFVADKLAKIFTKGLDKLEKLETKGEDGKTDQYEEVVEGESSINSPSYEGVPYAPSHSYGEEYEGVSYTPSHSYGEEYEGVSYAPSHSYGEEYEGVSYAPSHSYEEYEGEIITADVLKEKW